LWCIGDRDEVGDEIGGKIGDEIGGRVEILSGEVVYI
jgi:hypothetical protein